MTDFAKLVLAVDATSVDKGAEALDRLSAAGGRASGVSVGFANSTRATGLAAARMATEAQALSVATVGAAAGLKSTGMAANNARIAMLDMTHVGINMTQMLASGVNPMRALVMESGRLATAVQYSAGGIGGLVKSAATWLGIIKVTQNAELAETAAMAAASAASVQAMAQRAAGAIAAADTELALAEAAVRVATTAEAETVAQARVAAAHVKVAAAADDAAIAENALAVAQGRAAEAQAASTAMTVTRIGGAGVALAALAVVAGVAFGAVKQFQDQVGRSGELDKFAEGLRLTDEQIKKAGGSVKYLADGTRQISGLTVSFGDVMHGVFQEVAREVGDSTPWDNIKHAASSAFSGILDFWNKTSAAISAGLWTLADIAKDVFQYIGQKIGQSFYDGVNKAIDALNSLNARLPKALGGGDANLIPHIKVDKAVGDLAGLGAAIRKQADKNYADALAANQAAYAGIEKGALEHAKRMLQIESDSNKPPKPKPEKKVSDHGLAEALAELDAQIRGQNALAAAYQISDAEAIKAEAQQKAEEQAIRHKGEVGVFYEKELALAIAQRTADGAKVIAGLRFEADSRAIVNAQVVAGLTPAAQMNAALELEMKTRELTAAAQAAGEEADKAAAKGQTARAASFLAQQERALDATRNLTKANEDNNRVIASGIALQQISSKSDELDKLQLEINLVGESNRVRAVRLAELEAEQFIRNNNVTNTAEDPTLVERTKQAFIDNANATTTLAQANNAYNVSLSKTVDLLGLINEQAQMTSQALSNAFGGVGAGIGQALTALTNYATVQAKADQDHQAQIKAAGESQAAIDAADMLYAKKSANARMEAIGSVIGGLKGLFKEHSAGYKAMEAVEKAFAIAQLVRTIASIVPKIAAGAATMFSQLGVFAFPAVAAMVAVMAGLGFAVSGGGGSQKPPDIPTAGTGTILGDNTAQSQSIANSLSIMAKNSTKGLDYSSAMVSSLRKIESGIDNLAGAIARQLQLTGGAFDTALLGLGTKTSQGFSLLGAALGGLLGGILGGKKTETKTLYDQGIQFNPATIQQIIEQGITGATYNVIQTITKKSGFLGIGGSTKTSYSTITGPLDSDIATQTKLIIADLYKSVVDAAKVLGLDVADALKTFQVEIGKISFKDLKGDEITQALQAVFSKIADQMAGFAVAGLEQFQKAGEGLYETLMRLAKDYLTVDAALKSIGLTFGSVGVASVAARESLIELMGGLDQFVSQINYYYDHFLTQSEQTAFLQDQINAAFAGLGISVPPTIDAFKALVSGLDLTTDAGQAMFAALMAIAPAFYTVATAAQQAADAAAAAAAQLLKQKQDLQIQLLQAQGDTAAATALQRSIALAAIDPSLQALQQQVWAAQDAAKAAAAATALLNQKNQIQIALLQAQGKAVEAVALQRKLELAALDPTLRGLQQQVYAAQDVAKAKDNLLTAYKNESNTLQQTIDKFKDFSKSLRDFRDSLFAADEGSQTYNQALAKLMQTGALAATGDETALGGIQDAASKFLSIAEANASSLMDVQRAKALVARYIDQAIGGADNQVSMAEQQLAQLKTQVGALVDINDSVLTVVQGIQQLKALMFPTSTPGTGTTGGTGTGSGGTHTPRPPTVHETEVEKRLGRIEAAVTAGALSSNKSANLLDLVTNGGDSMITRTDKDTPVQVQIVG